MLRSVPKFFFVSFSTGYENDSPPNSQPGGQSYNAHGSVFSRKNMAGETADERRGLCWRGGAGRGEERQHECPGTD